jgi:hypothetical protein
MENKITAKRGLVLFLVIASVAIFIGLVWVITSYLPRYLFRISGPSSTPSVFWDDENCTYPLTYWVAHPELYPAQMILGNQVIQADDIYEALSNSNPDTRAQVQAQLVSAFLNFTAGADQELLEETIFQAYSWLVMHPDGSPLSESDLEVGSRYSSALEAYNLGMAGVPLCADGSPYVSRETPKLSLTPTALLTIEASQTTTSTPSGTASPTYPIATPIYTYGVPSNTPFPTTQPPGGQVPTATRTQPPSPTKTSQVPTPTKTPVPNTPTFTPPPAPTNTLPPPPPPP